MINFKENGNKSFALSVAIGVFIGFAAMFLLLIPSAFIMTALEIDITNIISVIILGISALVCGFASAKLFDSKALIIAPFSGIMFYLSVAVISAAITKSGFTAVFLIRLLISLISAALGGYLKTIKRKENKYI